METPDIEFTVKLPVPLAAFWKSLKQAQAPLEKDFAETFVLSQVKKHRITASKGAELLGISYQDFITLMDDWGVPVIDYPEGSLPADENVLPFGIKVDFD